jgi:hypothetical protein
MTSRSCRTRRPSVTRPGRVSSSRAAERRGYSQIKRIPFSSGQREPHQIKNCHSSDGAAQDLRCCGDKDRGSRTDDFFQIDLETDHEEQKNQPQLRNRSDGLLSVDQSESRGSDREAAKKIGQDHWLAKKLSEHPKRPCRDDAEGYVVDNLVHGGRRSWKLKSECQFKTICL